ncbi:uncharacterized protein [Ptychodera flava]|uniref:uncharacterized protein n=1 Tax=Ptychodera flava TaxID=63121 RepID=UPI00396A74D4
MCDKRAGISYILGAMGMVLIYTIYENAILPEGENAFLKGGAPFPKQVESASSDLIDDTSPDSVRFEASEAGVRRELKERLTDVRTRLKNVKTLLEEREEELKISKNMMKLALKHKTSVDRLIQKFKEVLLTNRTFAIGVVGGSISVGVGVNGTPGIYATTLKYYMKKMLGSQVTVENGAIGATNSYYYGYCYETHCNVRTTDLLLWEFAYNDAGYPDGYLGQERLTRMILADLPNKPQLIYTNFLAGREISRHTCVDGERYGSVPLSEYYDVPSISLPDAVCKQVKGDKADYLRSPDDDNHPGRNAHDMVAVFLAELIKEALIEAIEILEENLSEGTSILKSIRQDFKNWDDEEPNQKYLPPVLFNTTAITHPQCWTLMGSEHRPPEMTLVPRHNVGWIKFILQKKDYRSDLKRLWRTLQPEAFLEFTINIAPYKDLNSTIAITTITCERHKCGRAKVFLDDEYLTMIDCLHNYLITVVHEVAFNVQPGRHVLKIVTIDGEGFGIASVSTAYEIPKEEPGE